MLMWNHLRHNLPKQNTWACHLVHFETTEFLTFKSLFAVSSFFFKSNSWVPIAILFTLSLSNWDFNILMRESFELFFSALIQVNLKSSIDVFQDLLTTLHLASVLLFNFSNIPSAKWGNLGKICSIVVESYAATETDKGLSIKNELPWVYILKGLDYHDSQNVSKACFI